MKLEGAIIGSCDENPKISFIVNDVEFSDIQIKECVGVSMDEKHFSSVYSEGFLLMLIDFIVDLKKDKTAMKMEDKCVATCDSQRRLSKTTLA